MKGISRSGNHDGAAGEIESTPLPRREMFILSVIHIGQSMQHYMLVTLMVFMVQSYGVVREEGDLGRYTGLALGMFSLSSFMTSLVWGSISDCIGRKPCFAVANLASAAAMFSLAVSRSYTLTCATLVLFGLLNCAFSMTKSAMGEICDKTNQSRGFALLAVVMGLGPIAGSLLGGVLAQPCQQYHLASCPPLLEAYPFILPFSLIGLVFLAAFFCGLLLPETNPVVVKVRGSGFPSEEHRLSRAPPGYQPLANEPSEPGSNPGRRKRDDAGCCDPERENLQVAAAARDAATGVLPGQVSAPERPISETSEGGTVAAAAGAADDVPRGLLEWAFSAGRGGMAAQGRGRNGGEHLGAGGALSQSKGEAPAAQVVPVFPEKDEESGGRKWLLWRSSSFAALSDRDVLLACLLYGMEQFIVVYADTVFSIIGATPVANGGFGYSSSSLGMAMGVYGATMFLFVLVIYPIIGRRFGPRLTFSFVFILFVLLWPSLPAFAKLSFAPTLQWCFILAYVAGRAISGGTGFSIALLFVSNSSSVTTMGTVTGLSDTFAALLRATAPTCAGFLWSSSAAYAFPIYPFAASGFLSLVSLLGLIGSCFVSSALDAPRKGGIAGSR